MTSGVQGWLLWQLPKHLPTPIASEVEPLTGQVRPPIPMPLPLIASAESVIDCGRRPCISTAGRLPGNGFPLPIAKPRRLVSGPCA